MLKFVDLLSGHPIGCKLVGQKPTKFESRINFGPTPRKMIISNAILVRDAPLRKMLLASIDLENEKK